MEWTFVPIHCPLYAHRNHYCNYHIASIHLKFDANVSFNRSLEGQLGPKQWCESKVPTSGYHLMYVFKLGWRCVWACAHRRLCCGVFATKMSTYPSCMFAISNNNGIMNNLFRQEQAMRRLALHTRAIRLKLNEYSCSKWFFLFELIRIFCHAPDLPVGNHRCRHVSVDVEMWMEHGWRWRGE